MTAVCSVRHEAAKILHRIYHTDAYADILIDELLKNCSFSNIDRALLSELVYGSLRWRGRLIFLLEQTYHGKWNQLPDKVQIILQMGLYQLIYMDRIPDFAAINESVDLAKKWTHPKWSGTVNAILRRLSKTHATIALPDINQNPVKAIAVEYSHPEWMIDGWLKEFSLDRTKAICQANNVKPTLSLRVNKLKMDPLEIQKRLLDQGYAVQPGKFLDEFYSVSEPRGIFETELFEKGFFTIQDESAGLVSRLVDPKPGEIIFDMAAAPGGKTGHICELAGHKATVLSMDRHFGRLKRLRETLTRLGHSAYIVQGDGNFPPIASVDKIIVDAPCSGIGALRKRADLRWKMTNDIVDTLVSIQKGLLQKAVQCVRPNGVIVYSTCTVIKKENRAIAEWFIKQNPEFIIESAKQWVPAQIVTDHGCIETWPDLHHIDGSFAVRFKNGDN
ncbi:16S rRNA (cytosine(967)-C(5))-methyltransferase RsmB [bacterium]